MRKKVNEMILQFLQKEFNHTDHENEDHVWVIAAASYYNKSESIMLVRVVLRTSFKGEMNPFVDGTEIILKINEQQSEVELLGNLAEIEPIFHGGTVEDSVRWLNELNEPFFIHLESPF